MTVTPSLVIADVSHAFGAFFAVRQVDLSIRPGEVHCLLGPSGSGKSTLLRLVAGLEVLQTGKITISGRDVAQPKVHVRPEDRAIGLVFQDFALFPHLDVRRNVMFGMTEDTNARRAAAEEWLARVDLADFADAMPHTLSGGQQQRVALARALARKPAIMLLDEPFSGLDARLREDVRRNTLDLLRKAGVATLLVTHDPSEALLAGDQVSVMQQGRVLQTGTPSEVYAHAVNRHVAELFGPINRLTAQVVGAKAEGGTVETPWGPLPAPGHQPGARVGILIRPESLELSPANADEASTIDTSSVKGLIVDLRHGGSLLHLTIELKDGLRLEVQDLGRQGWRRGGQVSVSLGSPPTIVAESD